MSPRSLASVVVVNWNGRPLLERFLGHVVERTLADDPGHEVIVVDNGSADGSSEYVAASHKAVRLVQLPENLGFGGGNNAGADAARHPILVLLNNDVDPCEGFLAPVLSHFADPAVFAVMMKSLIPSRGMAEEAVNQLRFRRGRLTPVADPQFAARAIKPLEVLYACGGMVALNRARFLELGGFDELFSPAYWEDVDLSIRARRRGWRVLYEPASVVHHQHRSTTFRPELKAAYQIVAARNWHLLFWKHFGGPGLWGRYLAWETALAASELLCGDPSRLRALAAALRRLPQAWRARRSEARTGGEDAASILTRFGAFEWKSAGTDNG
ncbi:MAG: glycosyltransferase [Candidatus Wallbacteria bacterium]|nr:glycosyltransferase [Candidatus Wallbacteria bacterium]